MSYLLQLHNVNLYEVIVVLLAAIFLIKEVVQAIDWIIERLGFKTKKTLDKELNLKEKEEIRDNIKAMENRLDTMENSLNCLKIANRESLAQKIHDKYHKYISLGYIPEDEYEEFISLHDAYNGVGGNHNGDRKFEYCVNNLPIK